MLEMAGRAMFEVAPPQGGWTQRESAGSNTTRLCIWTAGRLCAAAHKQVDNYFGTLNPTRQSKIRDIPVFLAGSYALQPISPVQGRIE